MQNGIAERDRDGAASGVSRRLAVKVQERMSQDSGNYQEGKQFVLRQHNGSVADGRQE